MQKGILSAYSAMVPLSSSIAEAAWPDLLSSLCDSIRPLQLAPYRFKPIKEPIKPSDKEIEDQEDLAAESRSLTSAWLVKAIEIISSWYKELNWPVRVATFPLVISRLSQCMAVKHLYATQASDFPLLDRAPSSTSSSSPSPPSGYSQQPQPLYIPEVWRAAARAFVSVVQSGLPSINITTQSLIQQQLAASALATSTAAGPPSVPPNSETWDLLIRSFQMFLIGEGLDLAPESEPHLAILPSFSSSSSLPEDDEVQATVLDCLGDTVLTSCQFASLEARLALIKIMEKGTHSLLPPNSWAVPQGLNPNGGGGSSHSVNSSLRFSHLGLSKLYVLCSRGGQDPNPAEQSVRCQLDIAQLSLPIFVSRAESILTQYLSMEGGGRVEEEDQPGASHDELLVEKARHVLDLVAQLWVSPSVGSSLVASRPHLKPWMDVARARKRPKQAVGVSGGGALEASHKAPAPPLGEQTHLLALYGPLCECAASSDPTIRTLASGLLLKLGKDVGLLSSAGSVGTKVE